MVLEIATAGPGYNTLDELIEGGARAGQKIMMPRDQRLPRTDAMNASIQLTTFAEPVPGGDLYRTWFSRESITSPA